MIEPTNDVLTHEQMRAALDEMRAVGAGNDLVVLTTTKIRQQMAQWGLCVFTKDAWMWNGYEVRVDDALPPDNLYVVRRDSVLTRDAM